MSNSEWAPVKNVTSGKTAIEEQARRLSLLRNVARLTLISASVSLIGCFVVLLIVPDFPVYLLVVEAVAVLAMLAVLFLLVRGRIKPASMLSIASLSVLMFAAMFMLDGTRGPAILFSPLLGLLAGIIGERRYSQPTILAHGVFYIALVILEGLGVIVPYQLPELISRAVWIAVFVLVTAMMVIINRQFIASQAMSLFAAQQREDTLAEMNRQAQAIAEAQRLAQQQALETAQQLQGTVQEYVAFLERIAAGDYSAALDVSALAERLNLPQELISLGEYINTTVATLVLTLNEAQSAQQTYMRQSWEELMAAERVPGGYRYRAAVADDAPHVEVIEDAWLPAMTQAVRAKKVVMDLGLLAVPIASGARAQLIGALGVRREGGEAWSEDELALLTTVTDQLAQTLENLRLLDETTRRAAREQMASEITGHIREAVEIEAVLERALSELGRAFAAERGTAYLALSEQEEV